jgi:hypothetical protein
MVAALFAAGPATACAQEPAKTVRLTIDYGDGVQKVFTALPWKAELTVLGALEAAAKHPRGVKCTHRGSGASAFVTAIDGVANEGRGKNWTYLVNDKRANKSAGVFALDAGDSIVWRFAGE